MSLPFLLLGLALFFTFLYFSRKFAKADVARLAQQLRKAGGIGGLVIAAVLFATGRVGAAVLVASVAFALLGRSLRYPFGIPGARPKSKGQTSSVRTSHLEMILDHDSGRMAGRVVGGRFAGKLLSELGADELDALMQELRVSDPQGAQLLQAYLERMAGAAPGAGGRGFEGAGAGAGAPGRSTMDLEEAYRVLNLKPGATREEIQAAHRNLMKRFHPDQGGSTYLASKINEAKAVLLANTPA